MHPRISLADVRKGYRERDQSSTCLRAGTDAMSRRKQPNPKPLKVEEDLLSDDDDDDDDELVIFEDSSDGEGDTQLKDDLDGDYVGFDTAQGSEEEREDKEEVLEGSSTYKRLRPKRKCTRNIPTDDGDDDTDWKKSRTEETETHQLFACPTCSKGFKAQNEIQIHMRKHTGEKPFSCPFCHKAYPRRKTMYRHIREQHPEQWQRGRFPGRRYRAAINRAMKDSMRQWKLLRSTSSPGAAAGTEGSAVTGAEDQSKVSQLSKQETTSPPTTLGKKSPFGTLCGKYKKIAPAPLKPALAVVRQMPVSTPSGVQQQFFLVNSQSGVAVPINLTNTATDPAATNASTSLPSVAMPTNPQTFVQTTLSPVAMPTNPQTIVQASSTPVPVAMATHPHAVIQASSLPVPVAMPTNPQIVVQNSLSSVAMPTNPQTVVQTSSPCVAMPTNPQTVVQTNFSPVPVAMPTNPQTVVQTSLPPVAMAANPQMVLQTSSSPVVMPTDGSASFTQPMSLPSSLPLLNQPSQVSTATAAMATIITPPSPVFQQVVMPTFVPVQYQTPQVPMVAVSKATHLSQTAPVGQQAIMPKLFQAQNQGPILPLPAQRFSNVAMTASPPSQIAMVTTTPANPAVPPAIMPTLLPVQNQPAQVAVTTASQASLPNPTLSQVAMTKASSTKPVRILPVMTPTARTPTPIAPVIQEVAMPTCSPLQTQQPQVGMTTIPSTPPVVMTTLQSLLPVENQAQGVPMKLSGVAKSNSSPRNVSQMPVQHFVMKKTPEHSSPQLTPFTNVSSKSSVPPVGMATQSSSAVTKSFGACLNQLFQTSSNVPTQSAPMPQIQNVLSLRAPTSPEPPVLKQESSATEHSAPQFPEATSSPASVTNAMPVLQIQDVVTLTSSSSQITVVTPSDTKPVCSTMSVQPLQTNAQSTVLAHIKAEQNTGEGQSHSQAIPVQHSVGTVAKQQVSQTAVTSRTEERNVCQTGQISQTPSSPHQPLVRSGATENDACLPNLDVDSDEYLIAGDKARCVLQNAHGQMSSKQHPNDEKSDTSKQKTPAGPMSSLPESNVVPVCAQQVSKFRPILPRTLENCLFYDSLKDDRGQYKPLTADILERNNTCSLCGSMLRSLRYLIMHLFKFHQHYKCRLCAPRLSEFFASEQLLKSHLLQTHWPVHSVPNEDAARRLHYHFKRSCQAVEAVRAIGNPLEVSEITSSDICFKNGKALKYRVNYNILTPGRFMNDGDITVKRTSTNTLSITCIFFHTSSVLKGGNAQKADLASNSKGTTPSSADGTSVKRRTAPPPNVADLLKRFKAVSSTQKEGGPGMQTDVLSTSSRASGPSPHTAAASLSSPQSSSSSPHPTMSAGSNQSGTEHPKNPTDALECHRCDICGQVFAELQELQQHMNVHIELKPFKCNLCSRLFPHAATLEAHVKAHYKGEIEDEPTTIPANVKISFCKEARKSESTSEKRNSDSVEKEAVDSATADSEEDDPSDDGACNVCRLCGKTYTNSASLIRHLRTHQEGFKLSCPICGKGFNLSYHLKEHMNVHTKNKPYKCHICGKSFTHSGTLSAHLKCHKSREGIVAEYSSFSCRYCSVQFTHIKKYLDHLKVRHGVFDFDFEEAEKDIILCNASREANASQSCLVEAVDTAKESDKSEDVPATEAIVTTVAASVTQDSIQASSSSHTPASEQPESKTSGQAIRYPTGKTVAELIGLRKTKPAEAESFTNTSQSSGEQSPIVITQAISLRPFVDKIMAASTSSPDKAHGETPSVTKFKPILPKAYIRVQPFTSFQVAPGTTSTMEAAASNEGLDSANNKNMNEFRWKMKDSDPVQPVLVPDAEMAMYTSKQYQMTRVDPCLWYKCRKCGVGYTSILHLKHHICGACSKYMMKCEDCDLTFCSFKRLENHLTKEHLEEYNEDQQLSEESEEEGDDVRMDSAEEQKEQERQERRSSTQEKANHEYGQVVVKVEQIEDGSMEPTNYSATIKQEELEGQKWWFEGDNDLEGNKMVDSEVKEEDASFEEVSADDLDMENFLRFSERKEKTINRLELQLDDVTAEMKTEVQGHKAQVSDQVKIIGQHGSQSESSRQAVPHPDQSEHRHTFQERRQLDQSCTKEETPSVQESKFVDQTENVVLDIQLIQNSQSGRTLEGVSQPEDIRHQKHVDESGSERKGPQGLLYRCMLCGPKQEQLLASPDLALHLTGYHHVENPDVFLQGPLSCFSPCKS
ncbi:uncharacterized protein [Branchiostoma lanceolatum]|uniref:uncharacterized protein n=1 Tax=Branchiostoma lanceolatum TaxID=7740 RepID=UPI003456A07C